MTYRPIKRCMVISGKYWHEIGVVMEDERGKLRAKLLSLPTDPTWDGLIEFWELKKRRTVERVAEEDTVTLADFGEENEP